jgi:hypothetical protein
MAAAGAAVVGFAAPAGATPHDTVQVSTDPFTNATAPTGQHSTEVEPGTFAFGDTLVSAFQVGRITNGGADNVGWATSFDGGHSWRHGLLPSTTVNATPPGTLFNASDPSVAFDLRHHTWLISWIGLEAAGGSVVDVHVSRSHDGVHWAAPVLVAAHSTFFDKNWSVCDNSTYSPFFGHCYTEFEDAGQNDLVLMATSTDGGTTWGPPVSTADGTRGLGGQPVVQPNGRVVVPFEADGPPVAIRAFTSDDGGASWNASVLVSPVNLHVTAGKIRTSPLPSARISGDGTVFVVWQDNRFEVGGATNDIVLSTSRDGTRWSTVRRIPLDAVGSGVDHFIPGLAVAGDSDGVHTVLALAYYFYPSADCTPATCQLKVGFTTSRDGGRHWARPETLAGPMSLSWLANTSQGVMVGDYISASFLAGSQRVLPVYAVGRAPSGGSTFDESMFSAREIARGGPIPMVDDPVVFTGGVPGGGGDGALRRPPTAF